MFSTDRAIEIPRSKLRKTFNAGREYLAGFSAASPHPVKRRVRLLYDVTEYLFGREATILVSTISVSLLLSVFPFIVLLLTFANYFHWTGLREAIFQTFYAFFPISQEFIIRNLRIYTQKVGGLTIVSGLLLAFSGSNFFFAFEAGLDSAYRVVKYRAFVTSQVLGALMTVVFGVVAIVVIAALQLANLWGTRAEVLRAVVSLNLSFVVTFLLLFALYYYLPNRKQDITRVAREAAFATVAWMAGNLIFRLLAPNWALQRIYGPFFISVTLLLWGYLAGYIILGVARLSTDGFFDRRSP